MDVRKSVPTNYGYFLEKYGTAWSELTKNIQNDFPSGIEKVEQPGTDATDMPIFVVKIEQWIDVLRSLKDRYGYSFLTDETATDEDPSQENGPRFFLVVHLMHLETKARIRVKTRIKEGQEAPTLIPLWEGANWAEREIFDMFGIRFTSHPDLRRILLDERWEGHPLRKDYPLRGYQVFLTPEEIKPELLS
jgi:NADH-quinone oxidoreductase subunit C